MEEELTVENYAFYYELNITLINKQRMLLELLMHSEILYNIHKNKKL